MYQRRQYRSRTTQRYRRPYASNAVRSYPRKLTGYGAYTKYKPKYTPGRYRKSTNVGLKPILGAIGAAGGSYLGGPVGGMIGNTTGQLAAQGIKYLTGFGDYSVKKNIFSPGNPPSIRNKEQPSGGVVVRHKEYLGDIISSNSAITFKIQTFEINPGDETTFPWLSQVASNFQQYRFEGMLFEFRSMSADALNSTNTALGNVIMATNYNSSATAFASKAEMENCEFAQSVKPSQSVIHLIECAPSVTVLSDLYVRNGELASNQDPKFYDLGLFQIATTGCQGTNVNLGELWVSYQVCLSKPILSDSLGYDIEYAHFNTLTGVANGVPMGTNNLVPIAGSTLECNINAAGTILTIPQFGVKKTYYIIVRWSGSSVTLVLPSFTWSSGSAVSMFVNNTVDSLDTPNAIASGVYQRSMCRSFSGYSNTVQTLTVGTGGTLPSAPTQFDCWVMAIPNEVL